MSSGGRRAWAGWPDRFRAGWALGLPLLGAAVALAGNGSAAGLPYDLVTSSVGTGVFERSTDTVGAEGAGSAGRSKRRLAIRWQG